VVEFRERKFVKAQRFLDALRLSRRDWWTYHTFKEVPDQSWVRDWIFRGQSSEWPLLPKAWRSPEDEKSVSPLERLKRQIWGHTEFKDQIRIVHSYAFYGDAQQELPEDEQERKRELLVEAALQAFAEVKLINEYIALADELGFSVSRLPDSTRHFSFVREYLKLQLHGDRTWNYPSLEQERTALWGSPAVALAQHHGIATRLLDWTRNPITAAFFAAAGVQNTKTDEDDHIVVYALHREMLKHHIRGIEVPSGSNDFLRAQAGLFTLDLKGEEYLLSNGHYPTLEQSVGQLNVYLKKRVHPQKLILPVSQAPELLRLLWLERVTHAHLMPSLDHVAQAVQTKIRLAGETAIRTEST
jgi:hypothetical protein